MCTYNSRSIDVVVVVAQRQTIHNAILFAKHKVRVRGRMCRAPPAKPTCAAHMYKWLRLNHVFAKVPEASLIYLNLCIVSLSECDLFGERFDMYVCVSRGYGRLRYEQSQTIYTRI